MKKNKKLYELIKKQKELKNEEKIKLENQLDEILNT